MSKSYTRTYNSNGELIAVVQNEMGTRGKRMYKRAQLIQDLKTVASTVISIMAVVVLAYAFLLVA